MASNLPAHEFRLIRSETGEQIDLEPVASMVVGRGEDVDILVSHPTLSRRHAVIEPGLSQIVIRDLNSINGTYVNDHRIQSIAARAGDIITFGHVVFRLERIVPIPVAPRAALKDEAIIIRQRAVDDPVTALLHRAPDGTTVIRAVSPSEELTQRKLALLLEVSTSLSRVATSEVLLDQIAGHVFQIMDVDRLAILLTDPHGELVSRVARDRQGGDTARVVPRSIARRVVDEKIAVVSTNVPDDDRFAGASIVMQSVRSAMCAPLIGGEGNVLGVLYVDNLTVARQFNDDDLTFLVAFCGIAAVAIDNERYSARIRREAVARGNFERFFTPSLAARIASSTDALHLGGEKRKVVILFSDIRGFTPLAEHMPPDELAGLLNEYFTATVECVFRHGGTLDKFIGDSILAQWGAPVSSHDDADRALAAAFDMLDAIDQLNTRRLAEGRPELRVGIGLNAGEVFAGYIGSERRLEYTVLGDAVNTANRLCSAAAGGEVLVSEEMLAELEHRPVVEERMGLQLKGVSRAVRVFAVTSRAPSA